jgi:hypothetical protein
MALSAFYSGQYHLSAPLFQHALAIASDPATRADILYNISHVMLAQGDCESSQVCLELALEACPTHP